MCLKAVYKSIGCSDHNMVATSRKTKVSKAGPDIVYKRSYNTICSDSYIVDVKNICWSVVCNEEQTDTAPIKKVTVKTVKSLWIDEELKNG